MNIARFSIQRPLYPWMIALTCLLGGVYGMETVGRLEDPTFPIKNAYVITTYPGASAVEVEQEVTDLVEAALQELPYVDKVTSKSVPGRSEVQIEVLEAYDDDLLPQIWDELRRRVGEAALRFPPGVGEPLVEDDFGDVYGIFYAVKAPGYSAGDISDMSRLISKRLKLVEGVAKVRTAGEPLEAVFVELDHERMVRLGLPVDSVFTSIAQENQVLAAGSVAYGDRRLRIAPELAFHSVDAVADMRIGRPGSTEIMRLGDVASISRGPVEVPRQIIRHQGERVFTVGVSVITGRNVVEVGERVDAQVAELLRELPVGVEMLPIYRQHDVVSASIAQFLRNLAMSVATVVGALCIFMGWRAGMVVGSVLLLTVSGTVCVMSFMDIELQRISLGALMIAMGMLVDNAIVIAEGMVVGVQRGLSPQAAAERSVSRTQYALLGATVIGILAFAPIGLSQDNSGQYLGSLFRVVAISLLLSWVLAISIVPLLGCLLLKQREAGDESALYSGWGYAPYRALIGFGLRRAWLSAVAILAITLACFWGFQFVKVGFFPGSNTPIFFVDYYLPQGTDINTTSREMAALERDVMQQPGVEVVTSFVGEGTLRFSSTIRPELPNTAYAHMLVRVEDVREMDGVMARVGDRLRELALDAEMQIRRTEFNYNTGSKIEARFYGPDSAVLRDLADQALDVFLANDLPDLKTNWRQRELQIVPKFDDARARVAGVTRADVYQSLAFSTFGVQVGLFREADKLLPIIARAPIHERLDVSSLPERSVWSPAQQSHIPMSQIVSEFQLVPSDSMIFRRQRERSISAFANPPLGRNATRVFEEIRPQIESLRLPPGYSLEWGGEFESSARAEGSLFTKIPMTFGLMLVVTILMFGKLRQPLVIWLTVPMTVCGVVISLLVTDLSFTFPSILGLLSLSGMLIKNCVVLVDEIDKRMAEEVPSLAVIASASVSRLRPVMLAAGTTIAGMSPLLGDVFFREMAVCIMGGLAFATLLTLVAVPVFYRLAFSRELSGKRPVATRQRDGGELGATTGG